ncbi:hypothetical protein [Micromonospora zamorensis]|uniref:hypothetical protein n=1 Tax=Micromonospora zamorensis TaxID=709883 RepID=UPI002E192B75
MSSVRDTLTLILVAWWPGGLVAWWPGGLVAWWPGGLVAWWPGGLVAWWPGGLVAWWPGGLVAWWPGGLVAWCGKGLVLRVRERGPQRFGLMPSAGLRRRATVPVPPSERRHPRPRPCRACDYRDPPAG